MCSKYREQDLITYLQFTVFPTTTRGVGFKRRFHCTVVCKPQCHQARRQGGWKNLPFIGNLEISGREVHLFCVCNLPDKHNPLRKNTN